MVQERTFNMQNQEAILHPAHKKIFVVQGVFWQALLDFCRKR